jgi:hypothetical protein
MCYDKKWIVAHNTKKTRSFQMKKILIAASMMLIGSSGAWAAGTDAGTNIGNDATLSYSAGGVAQPDVQATVPAGQTHADEFLVDKKIDMVMSTTDTDQIQVTPGQLDQNTSFTFTNEGNSAEKFKFTVINLANNEEADYDTDKDNADVRKDPGHEMAIEYRMVNGGTWTALPASGILSVAEDDTVLFRVKSDIPTAAQGGADGDIMNIELKATAYKDDESGPESETNGADTQNAVDIVFADGTAVQNGSSAGNLGNESNSKGDTAGDGIEVGRSGYIIATPVLSINKTSCIVSDPVNNTNNPKRIPGAIIRYMFNIENTGSADATGIKLTDNQNGASMNDALMLANTKASTKISGDNEASCSCTSPGATDKSGDTTVDDTVGSKKVEITKIGVKAKSGAAESHVCVSFEVELD